MTNEQLAVAIRRYLRPDAVTSDGTPQSDRLGEFLAGYAEQIADALEAS